MNVVNIKSDKPYEVYIGRNTWGVVSQSVSLPGYFGNPVKANEKCPVCDKIHKMPGDTLECFEKYARYRIETDETFKEQVKGLFGKILGCYCKPKPCHGDVLVKLTNELNMFGE